jgi:hypothetical protein
MQDDAEDGTDYHNQYRVVWPDGSVHWLESQGKCQRDEDGQVARVVGVVTDVTQRKRARTRCCGRKSWPLRDGWQLQLRTRSTILWRRCRICCS